MQSVITPQVVHGVPKPPLGFSQAAGLLFSVLLVSHVHVPQHSKDILATRYPISATAALKRDLARLRKLDRERAALVVDPTTSSQCPSNGLGNPFWFRYTRMFSDAAGP